MLESKQDEEGHHEAEETHGLRQSESQNSIGEKLLLDGGVTGEANDQAAEYTSDSSSCGKEKSRSAYHSQKTDSWDNWKTYYLIPQLRQWRHQHQCTWQPDQCLSERLRSGTGAAPGAPAAEWRGPRSVRASGSPQLHSGGGPTPCGSGQRPVKSKPRNAIQPAADARSLKASFKMVWHDSITQAT